MTITRSNRKYGLLKGLIGSLGYVGSNVRVVESGEDKTENDYDFFEVCTSTRAGRRE
jgi:hypothetical protein